MIQFAGRSFAVEADRVWASGDVPPEDLAALAAMPNLRALNLNSTGITDDDVRRRRPACEIVVAGRAA